MRSPAGEARLGRSLGKYTLVRVIGEGGMAVVYEAVHRNGNRVALKMLRPEVSLGADVRARFVREGYAANAVGHPGAVRILDDDERDGAAFLVMELLEGTTLDALSRETPSSERSDAGARSRRAIAPDLAVAIVAHVLDTLAAAHAAGVVHRDVKPENVFLERSGAVKLLDFGIARVVLPGESSTTVTGRVLGTPAFVSPEQAYGRRAEVDARSDVYGAGATLFTILAGRLVHEAASPEEALILAATERAPCLASVMEIDARIAAVVDRALERDRDMRWGSAAQMAEALRDAHLGAFGVPVPETLSFGTFRETAKASLVEPSSKGRRWALVSATLGLAASLGLLVKVGAIEASPNAPAGATLGSTSGSDRMPPTPPVGSTAPTSVSSAPAPLATMGPALPVPTSMIATHRPARSAHAAGAPSASSATCGVEIDEEGRKWPRRCP